MKSASAKTRKLHMSASRGIVVVVFLLCLVPASSGHSLKEWLFPEKMVNLINESADDVYYMCGFDDYDQSFHVLPKGQMKTFSFTQHLFPARWCYLYLNDQNHGFLWAYTVRMKCHNCTWKIKHTGPFFYRGRTKQQWELSYLHPLPGIIKKPGNRNED